MPGRNQALVKPQGGRSTIINATLENVIRGKRIPPWFLATRVEQAILNSDFLLSFLPGWMPTQVRQFRPWSLPCTILCI